MIKESIAASCGFRNGGRYDTVVVGGGPAGFGAAMASARRGLKTLLIESSGYVGGVGTKCCAPIYAGFGVEGVQLISGVCEEFIRRMDELGAASFTINNSFLMPTFKPIGDAPITCKVQFKPEYMKLVFRRMLEEAGVECLFYTQFVDAVVKDSRISAILVSCMEGSTLIEGDTFIDCTGDALVCHAADPASVVKYSEEYNMHKSMFFLVGGVTPFNVEYNRKLYAELYKEGRVPGQVWASFSISGQLTPGIFQIAMCFTTGDGVNSADMTRMDGELRENVFRMMDFLHQEMPGFENCYLLDTPQKIGVRAGQGIIGKESVDDESVYGECATTVALTSRWYGAHSNKKNEFSSSWAKNDEGIGHVPMGALVPRALKNVLAAGRCISSDPKYISVFRMMSTCMTLGEAAGLMSFAARSKKIDVCDVEYADLLPLLKENSFIL